MRGRSPLQSLAASPTTVGAVTTLIVIVAVFLAYNANNGLPFVPVYRVSVEVPNAARLTQNNEVRIGGHRVGVVESIEVVQPSGEEATQPPSETEATDQEVVGGSTQNPDEVVARLNLKLDKSAQPLPVDSVFRIRYRSSFGLKYLEIQRGTGEGAPEGHLFDDPNSFIDQTEFDDIANTFDTATRENARINLIGFGNAFAGRGLSLNDAVRALNPLFTDLEPLAKLLTQRETALKRFFPALAAVARIVAPVATQQAELFGVAADTFAAISADPQALQDGITEGVPTLETGIAILPAQRQFLADFARLSRLLRPGVAELVPTLPLLNEAITTGTPVLNRTPELSDDLGRVFTQLEKLAEQPSTDLVAEAPGADIRRRRAAGQVRGPGTDRLQLLELLVHVHPQRVHRLRWRGLEPAPAADRVPAGGAAGGGRRHAGDERSDHGSRRGRDADGRLLRIPGQRANVISHHAARRRLRALPPSDCARKRVRPRGPGGDRRRLPDRPARLPARPGPAARPVAEQPGIRRCRHSRQPRPHDRVPPAGRNTAPARHTRPLEGAGDLVAMARAHGGHRLSNWVIGLLFIVLVLVGTWLAFTKELPWRSAYEVKAVFASSSNVRIDSPVRIAGVNVGKVTGVEHLTPAAAAELTGGEGADTEVATGASIVTMEISDEGRPIKVDSTFQLRPRLFLEGNLYVQVNSGTPGAVEAGDDYVFGIDQTSTTVQLDQILTTLQSDVREELQIALEEFGSALIDHGGAEGFREFYRTSEGAFKYSSQVEAALLGTEPHDLSNMIKNLDKVVAALGRHEVALQDLVTNFRIFAGSFAAQETALAEAISLLPGTLEAAKPAFANLNASFPPLRAFARELLPGVESTPATLEVATPFIQQLQALVAPSELGGLVVDLETAIPNLADLARVTPDFLDQTRALSSCFNEVVIPWSNDSVNPPANYPLGVPGKVFEETGYGLAGISGESRSGDGNAQYIRTLGGGGLNLVQSSIDSSPTNTLFGLMPFPIEGAIPSFAPLEDSAKTKFKPKQPCERQEPPNLGATLGTPPTQTTVAEPTPANLPTELASAYTDFTSLLGDLGEAVQLEEDGQEAEANQLEEETYEALEDLYADYEDVLSGFGGGGTTEETPTGGIEAEEGG